MHCSRDNWFPIAVFSKMPYRINKWHEENGLTLRTATNWVLTENQFNTLLKLSQFPFLFSISAEASLLTLVFISFLAVKEFMFPFPEENETTVFGQSLVCFHCRDITWWWWQLSCCWCGRYAHYTNDARLQVQHSNMLSRCWQVNTKAPPEWWRFNRGTTWM